MFGGKPSTSFSFGSQAAGQSTTPSKPLFGTATQQPTSTNLFGNTATSSSGPLFGSNTATSSGSLFGSKPATTSTASGGLFGSSTTTPASNNLFGNTTTQATTGGLFNSTPTANTGSNLFASKPATTGFGSSTTSGGLFGSKPASGGLFGSTTASTQQSQMRQKETLSSLLLNADALVRSLTGPELYGDDRDQIIAKLNQIAAALGVGNGFYKDGQFVIYQPDGPFHRFKSVGYNMISEFTEADGVVSLILKAPITELTTSAQKQALIDKLFNIIGGGANFPVKIKGIKEMPDNQTELNIFVINKASGTPAPSSSLANLLTEPAKKQQLEQLKVDKIIARFAMDKYQKERFIKDPPVGFDNGLWQQACRENPDPERLLPFPIRGFEQLLTRQKTQNTETDIAKRVIDNLTARLRALQSQGEMTSVKVAQQKVVQKQLSHRLLRILCMQLIQQRFGHPIDSTEESIKAALESLSARLNGPLQIKERLAELSTAVQDESGELKSKIAGETQLNLSESDVQQLQKYLMRCQDGLESLSNIVRDNLTQLQRISCSME